MYPEGTKIRCKGHEGFVKFFCPLSLTFTIGQSQDGERDVNLVVYSYDFDKIEVLEYNEEDSYHSQEHRYSDPQ